MAPLCAQLRSSFSVFCTASAKSPASRPSPFSTSMRYRCLVPLPGAFASPGTASNVPDPFRSAASGKGVAIFCAYDRGLTCSRDFASGVDRSTEREASSESWRSTPVADGPSVGAPESCAT